MDVSEIVVAAANAPAGILSVAPEARATSPPAGPIETDDGVPPLELEELLDVPESADVLEEARPDVPEAPPDVPEAQKPPSAMQVFVDGQHV